MMKNRFRYAATALASCALFTPQIAAAQQCIEEDDLADAVVYFMPVAFSAFTNKCSSALSQEGFVHTRGDAFIAPYTDRQDEAWDGTYRVFKAFAAKGKGDSKAGQPDEMMDMFDSMPPDVIRPFVDAIVHAEIAKEIKLDNCTKVERLLEPMAPLPPENLGTLIARTVGMIPEINEPKVCAPAS